MFQKCYLIENRKDFDPQLDIRAKDINEYTSLMATIFKGYNRCNNNDCNNYKYKADDFIKKFLEICDDDDLDDTNKYGFNALHIALMLYDDNTISDMLEYHKDWCSSQMKTRKTNDIINNFYGDEINLHYIRKIGEYIKSSHYNRNEISSLGNFNSKRDKIINMLGINKQEGSNSKYYYDKYIKYKKKYLFLKI